MKREEKLEYLTILGDVFDASALEPYSAIAQNIRLVLRLPETGAIAESPLTGALKFHAVSGVIVESVKGSLVVTKQAQLITPIIRYRTDIKDISFV
jgi:hypothetical protein